MIANNELALHVINLLGWERIKPDRSETKASLCSSCSAIESTRLFESRCDLSRLKTMSHTCDLCRLLLKALELASDRNWGFVNLRQTGAIIGIESGPVLLSLYTEPGASRTDSLREATTNKRRSNHSGRKSTWLPETIQARQSSPARGDEGMDPCL
jgi:hypothetical protein